jgi:hypothetical protein
MASSGQRKCEDEASRNCHCLPREELLVEPISPAVGEKLDHLRSQLRTHIDIAQRCIEADEGDVYPLDLWINAAIKRSMQVLSGFASMVRARNATCAGALLRIELDTVLRLFAATLVDDPRDFIMYLMKGRRLDAYRDRAGRQLRDRYLIEQFTAVDPKFAWVSNVYGATSGFVHMSGRHMLNMAKVTGDLTIEQHLGVHDDRWPEDLMIEAVDSFGAAVDALFFLVLGWLEWKTGEVWTMS